MLYKSWRPKGLLPFSDSFEYLCDGSTTIRNIFTLTVRGSTLVIRICRLKTAVFDYFIIFELPNDNEKTYTSKV